MTLPHALSAIVQEVQPFEVAWQTIDGLEVRYATNGSGSEKVVLFSPWPESIFAFAPVGRADEAVRSARDRPAWLRAVAGAR